MKTLFSLSTNGDKVSSFSLLRRRLSRREAPRPPLLLGPPLLMRKKTKSKKPSPSRRSGASVSGHPLSPPPSIVSAGAVCSEAPTSPVSSAPTQSIAQLTVSVTHLANQIPDLKTSSGTSDLTANGASDTANGLAP